MTTYKESPIYAEFLFKQLDAVTTLGSETKLSVREVLEVVRWRFKGGSMAEAAANGRINVEHSGDHYPDGLSTDIAKTLANMEEVDRDPDAARFPRIATDLRMNRANCMALNNILSIRARKGGDALRAAKRDIMSYHAATYRARIFGVNMRIETGLAAVYQLLPLIWATKKTANVKNYCSMADAGDMMGYITEVMVGSSFASNIHPATVGRVCEQTRSSLEGSRIQVLMEAHRSITLMLRSSSSRDAWEKVSKAVEDYDLIDTDEAHFEAVFEAM